MTTENVARHFDEVAGDYDRWKARAHYYYQFVKSALAEVVPRSCRACEMGCGTGDLLASLEPAEGLGVDLSPQMVELARKKHPALRFEVHDLMSGPLDEQFDYVASVDVAEHVPDLTKALDSMARTAVPGGTIIVITANPRWGGILEIAELLKLKMPEGDHEWRSYEVLSEAARAVGLREVSFRRGFVMPKAVPLLKRLNTSRRAERLRQGWGLMQRAVFSR